MKFLIQIFAIMLIMHSCNSPNANNKKIIKEQNKILINELIKNNKALLLDESLNNYSYTLNEKLISSDINLAFKGEISDVSLFDNSLTIDLTTSIDDKMYIARVKVGFSLNNKLKQQLKFDNYEQQSGVFIIKVSEVISKNIGFDEELEGGYTYITFGEYNKKIVIFKADLIDFILEI